MVVSTSRSLITRILTLTLTLTLALTLPALTLAAPLPPTIKLGGVTVSSINATVTYDSAAPLQYIEVSSKLTQVENDKPLIHKFPLGDNTTSPYEITVTSLALGSEYTLTFTLVDQTGQRSTPVTLQAKTAYKSPEIIGLFAQGTDDENSDFSNGDSITVLFDVPTNEVDFGSKEGIDQAFSFFGSKIGADYSGEWVTPRQFRITIHDIGQSAPRLGYFRVAILPSAKLLDEESYSSPANSTSPPLIGSWGLNEYERKHQYFHIVKGDGTEAPLDQYYSYDLETSMDKEVHIPVQLDFPDSRAQSGHAYSLNFGLTFPLMSQQVGFTLVGQNFSEPSLAIGAAGSPAWLSSLSTSVRLQPKKGYTGFVTVFVQLVDLTQQSRPISTLYLNVHYLAPGDATVRLCADGTYSRHCRELASNQNQEFDVLEQIKQNKVNIIIGVCVTFGVILLLIAGVLLWRRYQFKQARSEFESNNLVDDTSSISHQSGLNKRFYYESRV